MIRLKYIFLSLFLSLALIPSALAAEAFDIQNFQTDIRMEESGKITVTETIDVRFTEQRHGIFRDIQTEGISINVRGVTDEGGQARPYTRESFLEGVRLKIGHPDRYVSGKQVYKVIYDVQKAVRFFPDHDELYWNATGNAWPVTIHSAITTVKLPPSAQGSESLRFKCFTGATYSASEDCIYEYDEEANTVVFRANNPLPANNGMTIVVGMPPNIFERPTSLEIISKPTEADAYLNEQKFCSTNCTLDDLSPGTYGIELKKFGYKTSEKRVVQLEPGDVLIESFDLKKHIWFDLLIYSLILLALAIVIEPIYTFWKKGRDPRGRGTIIPTYEPPGKLSPAEMGTLVDEHVHLRDLTSTIVDLCVRGYMKIKVLPKKGWWIFKTQDYELVKLDKPKPGDRGMNDFEKFFMDKIFGSSSTKKVSKMRNKFYTHLPKLKEKLFKSLVEKEYFPKSPKKVRSHYGIKGFIMFALGFFGLVIEVNLFQTAFSSLFFVNGFLTLLFAYYMPRKTKKGVSAREHILGFKDYLKTAEKHRLEFQEKEHLFYEFLPYAMTLGVASKWSKAFEGIYNKPPEWYAGHHGVFMPTSFTKDLGNITASAGAAFASRPGGGSGGFGGSGFSGGFSGGGFGGGGGGSW